MQVIVDYFQLLQMKSCLKEAETIFRNNEQTLSIKFKTASNRINLSDNVIL